MVDSLVFLYQKCPNGLILAILSGVFAYYLYFRSFFRIVYSKSSICLSCKELGDWNDENNTFKTRILFYNNGRKKITKDENDGIEVTSSNGYIIDVSFIKGEKVNYDINNKYIFQLKELESKDFCVLEVEHKGRIEVNGSIKESGELLETEPLSWLMFTSIIVVLTSVGMFYSFYQIMSSNDSFNILEYCLQILVSLIILVLLRLIHSIFFIPDKINSEYLGIKNKVSNEFNNHNL
jgi:hypothetical protein